ncbi:Cys-tRNA(Pro) deacylase [Anaerosporobacter sp.]
MNKTNVMRLLEQAKIPYTPHEYEVDENNLAGVHVAEQIGLPIEMVFKTLVAFGEKHGVAVFCIPVGAELDLKKAAKAAGEKKIDLLPVNDLLKHTGYIRGGCSPIGMKKKYPTYFDETGILYDTIVVSAGARGYQIELEPNALIEYVDAKEMDLIV